MRGRRDKFTPYLLELIAAGRTPASLLVRFEGAEESMPVEGIELKPIFDQVGVLLFEARGQRIRLLRWALTEPSVTLVDANQAIGLEPEELR